MIVKEKIILKREWKQAEFRIGIADDAGFVEVNTEDFIAHVAALAKAKVPKDLAWTVRMSSMQGIIELLVRSALEDAIKEMKTDTIKRLI